MLDQAEDGNMRVNGEIFFLINGWMNYLSLLLAARLGRVRRGGGCCRRCWAAGTRWPRGDGCQRCGAFPN